MYEDLAGKMLRNEVDSAIEEALNIYNAGVTRYASIVSAYLSLTKLVWNSIKDNTEFTMNEETKNILDHWDAIDSNALYYRDKIDAVKFLLEIVGQYVIFCVMSTENV